MPYIRKDRQKLVDGTDKTYLSIAHNITEPGPSGKRRAKPVVMANLGPEDDLDEKMVDGLIAAFQRYKQKRFGSPEATVATAQEVKVVEKGLRLLASKAFGVRLIVEQVWKELGLDKALRQIARGRRLQVDLERITFGMVLHRLIDPGSKLACNEFLAEEAWFPEGDAWQVHHFYRALDVLELHADVISTAVAEALGGAMTPDGLKCLLVDTTSTYFEIDVSDEATEDEPVANRVRGHSKDHRGDKPQVVIGLVTDDQGRPLDHIVAPGNTHDQKLTVELALAARLRVPEGRVVVVCDSGMGGSRNLAALDKQGLDRVSGVPLRVLRAADELLLSKRGRWAKHPEKPGVTWRSALVPAEDSPSGRPELWVATRNAASLRQQEPSLERDIAHVRAVLKQSAGDGHTPEMCKIIATPRLKRFLKHGKQQEWVLDSQRVRLEERRCGVKVVRSTLVDLDPLVSLRIYERQYVVEHAFRTLEGPLKLRPAYHRRADRIRAHVLVCMLALAVMRTLETRLGRPFAHVAKMFRGSRVTEVTSGTGSRWQRTEWTEEMAEILTALGIPAGPVSVAP